MFWPFGLFLLTVRTNYILMHSNWLVTLAAGGGSKVVIVRFFVLFFEAIHSRFYFYHCNTNKITLKQICVGYTADEGSH
jgi:hypothetical protein